MAKISLLVSRERGPLQQIQNGIFGERTSEYSMSVDAPLRKIYMFSLMREIKTRGQDCILDIDVPENHVNALKATLLSLASSRWMDLYEQRIPSAGSLADAVAAERDIIAASCNDILRDLGFDPEIRPQKDLVVNVVKTSGFLPVYGHEDINPESALSNGEIKGVSLVDVADSSEQNFSLDQGNGGASGTETYDADVSVSMPIYGEDESVQWIAKHALPVLAKNSMLGSPSVTMAIKSFSEHLEETHIEAPLVADASRDSVLPLLPLDTSRVADHDHAGVEASDYGDEGDDFVVVDGYPMG